MAILPLMTRPINEISYSQSLRNIIAEGKLADEVGVDILALGEHHREEYAISSPDTVLAALAMVTKESN